MEEYKYGERISVAAWETYVLVAFKTLLLTDAPILSAGAGKSVLVCVFNGCLVLTLTLVTVLP